MLTRRLRQTAAPLAAALSMLVLSCAAPQSERRAADPTPAAANAEPVPAPSGKKSVIVPADVKLGPDPAPVNTGTAGPAVGPTVGSSSSPN